MTPTENNAKLMPLIFKTGINPDVIGALLEISGFAPKHIRYLCGPIVIWCNGWAETLLDWMPATTAWPKSIVNTPKTASAILPPTPYSNWIPPEVRRADPHPAG